MQRDGSIPPRLDYHDGVGDFAFGFTAKGYRWNIVARMSAHSCPVLQKHRDDYRVADVFDVQADVAIRGCRRYATLSKSQKLGAIYNFVMIRDSLAVSGEFTF